MNAKQMVQTLVLMFGLKKSCLLVSAPGCGKTDIVHQAAQQAGAKIITMFPAISDPTDAKGLPALVDGKAVFLPFADVQSLIDADTLTVCFLDDLGQASPSVQAAYMQLILARRVNGMPISDHVVFAAATNRREDKAGVQGILEPVKSRFTGGIYDLSVDSDLWALWALKNGIAVEVIAFVRFRPGLLHDFSPSRDIKNYPCPRTVAGVGLVWQSISGLAYDMKFEIVKGIAGEAFAAEFLGFIDVMKQLPSVDSILLNPDTADVPTEPAALYALCGVLAGKASDANIERVIRYANRLPDEFSVLLVWDCQYRTPEIKDTRAFIEWSVNHQEVLT